MTNRQIAERMYLAEKTVKNYVSSMLAKLGLSSRTQAAIFATKHPPKAPDLGVGAPEPSARGRDDPSPGDLGDLDAQVQGARTRAHTSGPASSVGPDSMWARPRMSTLHPDRVVSSTWSTSKATGLSSHSRAGAE